MISHGRFGQGDHEKFEFLAITHVRFGRGDHEKFEFLAITHGGVVDEDKIFLYMHLSVSIIIEYSLKYHVFFYFIKM